MFVAMGLSAVIPVLHGVRKYGAAQMGKQIGLSWLVGQGMLYIAGAAIYAVSSFIFDEVSCSQVWTLTSCRLECQSAGIQAGSTSSAALTRYSTC